jgi:hypothetical protein
MQLARDTVLLTMVDSFLVISKKKLKLFQDLKSFSFF